MEPMPESLWWTSTYKDEDRVTLIVENRDFAWDLPFKEVFEVFGVSVPSRWEGCPGAERTLWICMGSWWRDGHIYRSKTSP